MEDYKQLYKDYYDMYISQCQLCRKISSKRRGRFRKPNFPELISEFFIEQITGSRKAKVGDLVTSGDNEKRIEVKCIASNGPVSFGPKEKWDILVLVDAREEKQLTISCYYISNKDPRWQDIQVSRTQTFYDKAKLGQRPRLTPNSLYKQLLDVRCKTVKCTVDDLFTGTYPQIEI